MRIEGVGIVLIWIKGAGFATHTNQTSTCPMSQNKHDRPTGSKISTEEMRRLKLPLGAELANTTK